MKLLIKYTCLGLLMFVFAVLLSSCDGTGRNIEAENPIVFDTISTVKVYHLDQDSTKPSCSVNIKYIYPAKFEKDDVLFNMQQELNYAFMEDYVYESLSPREAVEKYIENYIENYRQEATTTFTDKEHDDDRDDFYSFSKTLDSKILFNKANIVSYQAKMLDYKRGVNTSTIYKNLTLNLATGKALTEQDIYLPESASVLNSLLKEKILTQNNAKRVEDLLQMGYYDIEDLASNGNFWIDDKGITYIYNQREISTPSIGETIIFLTYSELSSILEKKSPLAIFIK